ncbi:DNA-binding FadR family transcriptional regulator [Rhizobium aethiopicum]|uniref:DNA-binding FadR family transcriptional regulator n=1 Tax=Rhizobium aethiopicum TaxID=1138170 RepID=A0A7W6MG15_9HYPH|nr:GntR family transcriptional regulator [Rhizobium aethiopicum]MBB4191891.1 DNA-binding FadR family transcriptional regulator [Rhizobium aethiopicum]MBB4579060.1 DNA-binding FadR family transcriptional regulator [Rhizobium aethiopicum]
MSIITQRGNLAEIVVAKLTERIDSGLYAPGEKIPSSAQLCEEFGASRTVVREALTSRAQAPAVLTRLSGIRRSPRVTPSPRRTPSPRIWKKA